MTLDTRVFVHDRVKPRELFLVCNRLIGAHEGIKFRETADGISNEPGQGLCAWLIVHHGSPWRSAVDPETGYPACWAEVSFDTAYGYQEGGEGCGDLHARIVGQLGAWLDGKGIRWSWLNEWTGEIHEGAGGLDELCR